jgi:hypothetical protein
MGAPRQFAPHGDIVIWPVSVPSSSQRFLKEKRQTGRRLRPDVTRKKRTLSFRKLNHHEITDIIKTCINVTNIIETRGLIISIGL